MKMLLLMMLLMMMVGARLTAAGTHSSRNAHAKKAELPQV